MKIFVLNLLNYLLTIIGVVVQIVCAAVLVVGIFLVGSAFWLLRLIPRPIVMIFIGGPRDRA